MWADPGFSQERFGELGDPFYEGLGACPVYK